MTHSYFTKTPCSVCTCFSTVVWTELVGNHPCEDDSASLCCRVKIKMSSGLGLTVLVVNIIVTSQGLSVPELHSYDI